MRWWETSIGGAARGRIIALLRRGERTVDELAAELGVTDNAVRAHVDLLEREGIVTQTRVRREGAVGKPATLYAIAPEADGTLSAAYAPVLTALVSALRERMSRRELDALYRDAGRRLAASKGESEARGFETRVRAAATLLAGLGAELDVAKADGGFTLQGHACPLSDAVRADPSVCQSIRELVAQVTGESVRECCDRDGASPKCRLEIRRSA
jgi:predicted ArsR family transcriptional regulator